LGRGAAQDQPAVPATAQAPGDAHVPQCPEDSCDPGQLWHPRQPPGALGAGDGARAASEAPLPAPLLSGSQPDRTGLARLTRQRHAEPPVPDSGGTHGPSEALPQGPERAQAPLLPQGHDNLKVSRNRERSFRRWAGCSLSSEMSWTTKGTTTSWRS